MCPVCFRGPLNKAEYEKKKSTVFPRAVLCVLKRDKLWPAVKLKQPMLEVPSGNTSQKTPMHSLTMNSKELILRKSKHFLRIWKLFTSQKVFIKLSWKILNPYLMRVALIATNNSLHEHKVDYPALQRITSNSDICEFFKKYFNSQWKKINTSKHFEEWWIYFWKTGSRKLRNGSVLHETPLLAVPVLARVLPQSRAGIVRG